MTKKLNVRELIEGLNPDSFVDVRTDPNHAITSIYAREVQELIDADNAAKLRRRIAVRLGQIKLLSLDNVDKALEELVDFIREIDP